MNNIALHASSFSTATMIKRAWLIFCLMFATLLHDSRCIENAAQIKKEILDHILPKNPNEIQISPGSGNNGSTEVQVFLHLKSIDKVCDKKMEMSTRFIIRQLWKDPRLRYSYAQIGSVLINDAKVIWTPDIYFPNLVNANTYDVMRPTTYLRIFPDGTVLYSKWVSLTTSCPMDLKMYPFDYQTCDLLVTTYGSTTDDVVLVWKDISPVTISSNLIVRVFNLEKFLTHYRTAKTTSGTYTTLVASLVFERIFCHYLIHVFVPCTLLVILSWIPYWINRKQLTIRLIIGLSALATLTILMCDYNKNIPKLSYTTWMDYFCGTCFVFAFGSIIESTIVYLLGNKSDTDKNTENNELKDVIRSNKWFRKLADMADRIDFWIRFIVPLVYLGFCMIYFGVGTTGNSDHIPHVEGNHTTSLLKSR